MTDHAYHVELWGSHPDEGNDDCWCGTDHATLEVARKVYETKCEEVADGCVELVGPDVREVHDTGVRRKAEDSGTWQREMAMEAGMLHGVDAYNEAMGWDMGEDSDG